MYASVLIMYDNKTLDKVFTYKIPSSLNIKIGTKVLVPFNNKDINGIVLNINKSFDETFEVKEIKDIVNDDISFSEELIKVAYKLKELTLCTLTSAFKTMVPSRLKVSNNKNSLAKYDYEIIPNESNIYDYLKNHKRALKQNEFLNNILNKKIKYTKDIPSNLVNVFKDNYLIELKPIPKYRINKEEQLEEKPNLTIDQQRVVNNIIKDMDVFNTHLIYGVTASGKTEVYFNLISEVLKNNKTALVLVPEITLSTQLINRFYPIM